MTVGDLYASLQCVGDPWACVMFGHVKSTSKDTHTFRVYHVSAVVLQTAEENSVQLDLLHRTSDDPVKCLTNGSSSCSVFSGEI